MTALTWSLSWYCRNWPKVGIVGSAAIAGSLALRGRSLSPARAWALANLAVLGAHQFEEHVWPGYFAGVFNGPMNHSSTPATYPVDALGAMLVNTVCAYPANVAPVIWPHTKWLTLGTALFGFSQTLGHCAAMPARSKVPYVPGAVTAALLYAPVGAAWIRNTLREQGRFTRADLARTAGYLAGYVALGILLPEKLTQNPNSTHRLQPFQVRIPAWNHMGHS